MKKNIVSLVLNILIVFFVALGSIFMFMGVKFMPDHALLEEKSIHMFKYFTVDSNLLVGLASLVVVVFEVLLLKKKIKKIPVGIYTLKMVATSGVTLTFFVTLLFLAPKMGLYNMYNNNNLFFHLIVPVLAMISYTSYEKYESEYKDTAFGLTPMLLYALYYISNILYHFKKGEGAFKYDFYGFLQGNIKNIYVVIPIILIVCFFISLSLIFLNKKISGKEEK